MMTGELKHHISESKLAGQPNRKNGKSKKTVRSLNCGEFELETGRGRLSTFEPKFVPKRQLIITEELEGNILSMYAMGMSTRAMRDYIQEMYAMDISAAEISRITDSVLSAVQGMAQSSARRGLSLCIPGLYVFQGPGKWCGGNTCDLQYPGCGY